MCQTVVAARAEKRRSHVIFSGSRGSPGPSWSVKALVNIPVKVSGGVPTDSLERRPKMLPKTKRCERRSVLGGWLELLDGYKAGPIFSAIKEARSDHGGREIESRDSLPSLFFDDPSSRFLSSLLSLSSSLVALRFLVFPREVVSAAVVVGASPENITHCRLACTTLCHPRAAVILQPFAKRPAKVLTDKYRNT